MKPALLAAALLAAATVALAASHPPVDGDLLRDVVCDLETRGHPRPAWAVGTDPLDWGLCQIRYTSAVLYGRFDRQMRRTGTPSRNPGELFIPEVSRATARAIVALCIRFYPRGGPARIGYCYVAGPWAEVRQDSRKWAWALSIATEYQRRAGEMRLADRR